MIISFVNSKVHQLFIYLTSKRYMNANQFIRGFQVVIFSDRMQQLSCPWSIIVLRMKNCFQQSIILPVSDFLLVAFYELHTFQEANIIQFLVSYEYKCGQVLGSSAERDSTTFTPSSGIYLRLQVPETQASQLVRSQCITRNCMQVNPFLKCVLSIGNNESTSINSA